MVTSGAKLESSAVFYGANGACHPLTRAVVPNSTATLAPVVPKPVRPRDSMNDAQAKLCSVRHYCFVRGVIGKNPDADFLQAFRTINRLYVDARSMALNAGRIASKRLSRRRGRAA
jgi:hypothetical protein